MVEVALLFIVATGGLVWAAHRWQQQQNRAIEFELEATRRPARVVSTIADGGLYHLGKPGDIIQIAPFRDLHLTANGMALTDNVTQNVHTFDLMTIQWVSAIELSPERVASIAIHLEQRGRWWILTLQLPEADMALLARVLRRFVASNRMNIGNRPIAPIGPIDARLVDENLQGETALGAGVQLYLLPPILVVLREGRVQARLDTSSIRRILAVERINNRLDSFLSGQQSDGIIRLYSMHESVAFALTQYRELAEAISQITRSPVEFITQMDKAQK